METFKIYRLRSVNIESPPVYCSEGETCKNVCSIYNRQKQYKCEIVYLENNEEKCFKTFQILISKNVNFEPFMFKNELFLSIFVSLNFDEDQQILNFTLDSGAQINCISQYFLKKYFSKYELKMQKNKIRLIAANGEQIQHLGMINLCVGKNHKLEQMDFYVLKTRKNFDFRFGSDDFLWP